MDLVSKLNDRNLSFPARCTLALSLLKPSESSTATWLFPRKNQYLFDWLTGSLLKLSKGESPKAEIFLDKAVWELMKEFSLTLFKSEKSTGLKRSINFITNDEEFFDYKKCFDSQVFVIKCPLLTIFQTSLSLLSESVDKEITSLICSVILTFLQQTRVSLPVSFSQVTDFVRSLVKCKESKESKENLQSESFNQILRPTLNILSEIVLGGGANYKKTYPLLVKFCIESAGGDLADEIWIEFIQKCLFSSEFHDELLTFLISPSITEISSIDKPLDFPKSLTFQKGLFIELASNIKAVESCPLIYEAFLRSVGTKINRETGFNFFTFLLRKTLPNNATLYSTQLTKLISVLHQRGNEIYQQRNDETYRKQSSVIEEIFHYAINEITKSTDNTKNTENNENNLSSSAFPLLLSLAKLNYYLVAERLNLIFTSNSESVHVIEFVIGMLESAALANQLPVLLEIIMKSNLSVEILKHDRLQMALIGIFNFNLSPNSLHQIYLLLIIDLTIKGMVLLVPVIRSIVKVVDNVETFDKELYAKLQRQLLTSKQPEAFNLLSEIVRWSPGTFLLIDELFKGGIEDFNLLFTLKCKDPSRISCKSLKLTEESYGLVLKYLPVIADDMETSQLEDFSNWLIRKDKKLCISTLKMTKLFEIKAVREPFIKELIDAIDSANIAVYVGNTICAGYQKPGGLSLDYVDNVIKMLPWEYLTDEMVINLTKKSWFTESHSIPHLLSLPPPLNVRKEVLKSLVSTDLPRLVSFLLYEADCDKDGESTDDFASKCFSAEHSQVLIKAYLAKIEESSLDFLVKEVAKMLKYADFESEEIISFIETKIDLVEILKPDCLTVELLDNLDIILEWIVDYRMEYVAAAILALPATSNNLKIDVRCQALRCKFPARTDTEFINESVELASRLSESPVTVTFKKDLLSLIKELPSDQVKALLESFLSGDSWKFSLGLQALNQLLHISNHIPATFTLFNDNLEKIYTRSLRFDMIPAFLAVLKSIIQLKKNVTWESKGIANILGVLRRARQAQPQSYDEIFVALRLIITLHLRQFRSLLPLLVSNICEAMAGGVTSVEESTCLGRILSELGSLRRGELEPFALLPILHSFISSKYPSSLVRKPLQLAMSNLMYHLGTKKQLLQFLSTALVVEHEHRVILKSFIDEYNKFHKYSGRA